MPYPMSQNAALEQLMEAIKRLSDTYAHYQRLAMKEVGLPATDSFFYLQSLNHLGEIQKVVLIRYQYAEPTTGRKAIERLVKASYVQERPDPDDARATLIKLTENGKRKLHECRILAGKVTKSFFMAWIPGLSRYVTVFSVLCSKNIRDGLHALTICRSGRFIINYLLAMIFCNQTAFPMLPGAGSFDLNSICALKTMTASSMIE